MRYGKRFSLLLLPLLLFSFGCGDEGETTFTAALSGANEVPATASIATGNATFVFDENDNAIRFGLSVSNISNVIAAHIHNGAAGVNGDVVAFLFNGPQTGTANGQLSAGTIRPTDVTGITFDQLVANMKNGTAYVNVHTVQNPDGEIRGQIAEVD